MELLRPLPVGNGSSGIRSSASSSANLHLRCDEAQATSLISSSSSSSSTLFPPSSSSSSTLFPPSSSDHRPEVISEETLEFSPGKVYVAVGSSTEKAASLLRWTFRQFPDRGIVLLHVHRPSKTIPTLLGNLPASQANPEALFAHRRAEKEQMKKTVCNYLKICRLAKVQATAIVIEAAHAKSIIVDLLARFAIQTLVMGSAVDGNKLRANAGFGKAQYAVNGAPLLCEIWFLYKGKHVWTREATEDFEPISKFLDDDRIRNENRLRSRSVPCQNGKFGSNFSYMGSFSSKSETNFSTRTRAYNVTVTTLEPVKQEVERFGSYILQSLYFSPCTFSNSKIVAASSSSPGLPSSPNTNEHMILQLISHETAKENTKVLSVLVEYEESELCLGQEITEVKQREFYHVKERETQEEAEDTLRKSELELEKLLKHRDEVVEKLHKTLKTITHQDGQDNDSSDVESQATQRLRSLQVFLVDLRRKINSIRKLKDEAIQTIQLLQDSDNCDGFLGSELSDFTEYTFIDLQTATCNFSDSFKLGEGGYGCVYKGEISGRTVAVKKFHAQDKHSISEFQQEVEVLSKLRHPNLLILLGSCSESLSLVYEYLPNGSLQRYLVGCSNTTLLTWQLRVQIAAQITSALLFLHSCKPEKIVHGDLKPENILLDSDFTCKIGDFGISSLLPDQNTESRMMFQNIEPKGSCAYMDPEFQRTGNLTPASDVYAFGIVVLQLVTGKPPLGLAKVVRRAAASRKLEEVIDASAGEWPMSSAQRMIELGLRCCEVNARDRLKLSLRVVQELEQMI